MQVLKSKGTLKQLKKGCQAGLYFAQKKPFFKHFAALFSENETETNILHYMLHIAILRTSFNAIKIMPQVSKDFDYSKPLHKKTTKKI